MTVRVLEPNSSGHRLYYVRVLAEGSSGPVEWVTTAAAAASPEAAAHLSGLTSLTVRVLDPWPGHAATLRLPGASLVAVPDGDRWLPAVARVVLTSWLLRRSGPSYRVLLMRPDLGGSGGVRQGLNRLVKWTLVRALALFPSRRVELFGLVDAFGFGADQLPKGLHAVADPVLPRDVPDRDQARRELGVENLALTVGLLGAVDARKNPGLVATACQQVFAGVDGRLLVVGGVRADALEALGAAGLTASQLVVDNRYVEEVELVRAARACDALALLYDNHDSSSGVLALAAQAGVPVVVPRGSRLAGVAVRGGFGVPSGLSATDVSAALTEVLARHAELSAAAAKAGCLVGTDSFVRALTGPRR